MLRLTDAGAPEQMMLALAIALVAASVVRTVTAGLGATPGRAWPFSLARCHAPASPGCFDRPLPSAAGGPAQRIRTGRL